MFHYVFSLSCSHLISMHFFFSNPSGYLRALTTYHGPVVQSPIKLILDKEKNFNCYLLTAKAGFFTGLRFKEKNFLQYNHLIRPQFCGKSSFSRK